MTDWPIQVGGEYRTRVGSYSRIVRRITDKDVFTEQRLTNGELSGKVLQFSLYCFRADSFPEDQSPIPQLLAALKDVRGQIEKEITRGGGIFSESQLSNLDAALAAAEGRKA